MEQKKKACKVIVPSVKGHKGKKTTEVFGIVHINNGCYWERSFLPPDLKDLVLVALTNQTVEAAALVLCTTCINKWISHFEITACVCFKDDLTSG